MNEFMDVRKIDLKTVSIEIMSSKHDISSFTSYEQDLVAFLKEDALKHQEQNLSVTFLWFYQQRLVSYLTLLTDKIQVQGKLQTQFKNRGINYYSLPALKIGRLCVDDNFRKKGMGRHMVEFAVKIANKINKEMAGCRFLTVDAKRNKDTTRDSFGFYQKVHFEPLKFGKDTTLMCMDTKLFSLP